MEIVITTIFPPSEGARQLAEGLERLGAGNLWVIGDRKGPWTYELPRTRFFSIDDQAQLDFGMVHLLPEGCYARKNLGYLLAIQHGAKFLVETDDDNIPLPAFWEERALALPAREISKSGWYNVYRDFSEIRIWPRGFPLECLQDSWGDRGVGASGNLREESAYIQQGLANENPDVDAVYRLTQDLPIYFDDRAPVSLASGTWCPFNSQNTTFFSPAFPLLYLPTHCSFRMTDIWRSFIAQRCLWAADSRVVFSRATVFQRRNEHSLLRDFKDEIPGYLENDRIRGILEAVTLKSGTGFDAVGGNLLACYDELVRVGILPAAELPLVGVWLADLQKVLG